MKKVPTVNTANALVVAQSLQKEADPQFRKIRNIVITTQEDYQEAAKLLSQLKDIGKLALAEQEKFTKPLNELLKVTRSHFKPFFAALELLETAKKAEMIAFLNKQEAEAKKLEKKFEEGGIKKFSTLSRKQEELQVTSDDATVRRTRVVKITSIKKLPKEFMEPDMTKIRLALLQGVNVPGAELVEEKVIAI